MAKAMGGLVGLNGIAALFAFAAQDALVPLVMMVAFAGIAHHNWGDSALVSVTAIVFAVIAAGLAGAASLLAFERDTNRGPFGRGKRADAPPPMTPID